MKACGPIGLILVFALLGLAQRRELPAAQAEMVAAERAFAKLGRERGFLESFITYFAEDGIGFNPHPYPMKETLSRRPAPSPVPPIGFDWAPAFGDIARAGDLGWDTGPVVFDTADPARKSHGMFFSVWKKQSNGMWRVVLDLGGETPSAIAPLNAAFQSSFRPSGAKPQTVDVQKETAALLQVEREFFALANTRGAAAAYTAHMSDDLRVHRPGIMPAVGKAAVVRWLQGKAGKMSGEPVKADVSTSGDLGYAYGAYDFSAAPAEKGYFARVWKREPGKAWKIVMDTVSIVPPTQ